MSAVRGHPPTATYVVLLRGTGCSKIEMMGGAHRADLNLHFAPKWRNMHRRRRKPAEQEQNIQLLGPERAC